MPHKIIAANWKMHNDEYLTKNYEMSDIIRDILESSNIQIEDSTDKIEWKIKD